MSRKKTSSASIGKGSNAARAVGSAMEFSRDQEYDLSSSIAESNIRSINHSNPENEDFIGVQSSQSSRSPSSARPIGEIRQTSASKRSYKAADTTSVSSVNIGTQNLDWMENCSENIIAYVNEVDEEGRVIK